MSLENPDRACAICGEAVHTNDSDNVVHIVDDPGDGRGEPAHRACVEENDIEAADVR